MLVGSQSSHGPAAGVEEARWVSIHTHFAGRLQDAACDELIRRVVAPFVAACREDRLLTDYFFVRYVDLGPHIRLRCATTGPDHTTQLWRQLLVALRAVEVAESSSDRRLVTGLRGVPYSPETERYGGTVGLALTERFFTASSEFAVASLARLSDCPRSKRLGQALLAAIVVIHAFCHHPHLGAAVARRCGRQGAALAPVGGADAKLTAVAQSVWVKLDDGETLTQSLDALAAAADDYATSVRDAFEQGVMIAGGTTARSWPSLAAWLVPSVIHMTNNRLGLTRGDEERVAALAEVAFRDMAVPAEPR